MNIIITNVHSIHNAGDAVLLNISQQLIRQAYPNATITIIINDPTSAPAHIKNGRIIRSLASRLKNADGRWNPAGLLNLPAHRAWLKAYRTADVVVSVAGNFLYSSGKLGIPFMLSIAELAVATHYKKRTIIFPQTLGPVWRKRDQRLLAWLSKRLTAMFVRDELSRALVGEIGGRIDHITIVPDIAFAYPPVSEDDGHALLQKHAVPFDVDVPLLGITAINWGGLNTQFDGQIAYEQGIIDTIAHFVQTYNGHVILFSQVQGPSTVEDDRLTAKRIYEQIAPLHDHVTFINETVPADTLKSAYGQMDIFIGTRLHSNIFALTEHTPVVAIAYQPKTRGVLKLLDLEEWVIDIEDVSAETLIPKLDTLWQQKADVETHIRHKLTTIHAQLHTIVKQLRQL